MATATTGIFERAAVAKAPFKNRPIWRFSSKVPSGKNISDWPAAATLQHPARIDGPLVPVEALDELRTEAPQQETHQRNTLRFLLDDEGKIGRQGRDDDDGVDVAGMVGHHHAGCLRQALQSLDCKRNTGHPHEGARQGAGHCPALALFRQEQIDPQHGQTQGRE